MKIKYFQKYMVSVWRIKHSKEISELFLVGLFRGCRLRWTKYILSKNKEKITKIIYETK